jgi:DNA-directed RNA polymerase specialized sigma subunit
MSAVLTTLAPTLNSEVQRYGGSKPLLRSKAKALAVKAVKSYDPASAAKLNSWVVTQLQPLSRYGRESSEPVRVGETAYRQNAALLKATAELEDEQGDVPSDQQLADRMGIPPSRIQKIRDMNRAVIYEGQAEQVTDDGGAGESVNPTGTDPILAEATELVYASLGQRDQVIFDLKTGGHGRKQLDNKSIARRLGVSPAFISQRSAMIGKMFSETANIG